MSTPYTGVFYYFIEQPSLLEDGTDVTGPGSLTLDKVLERAQRNADRDHESYVIMQAIKTVTYPTPDFPVTDITA